MTANTSLLKTATFYVFTLHFQCVERPCSTIIICSNTQVLQLLRVLLLLLQSVLLLAPFLAPLYHQNLTLRYNQCSLKSGSLIAKENRLLNKLTVIMPRMEVRVHRRSKVTSHAILAFHRRRNQGGTGGMCSPQVFIDCYINCSLHEV